MSNRKDICTPRKKNDGGTYWVKIGTAWENEKGIQLVFDALPIPDAEGRCVAHLFDPKPRDGGQRPAPQQQRGRFDDLNDEIPPF